MELITQDELEIEPELIIAERDFDTAQKALNAANQALQACLDGS